jgi:hypothetical protein
LEFAAIPEVPPEMLIKSVVMMKETGSVGPSNSTKPMAVKKRDTLLNA